MRRYSILSSIQAILVAVLHEIHFLLAMNTLETGPKLDWTRDNQMYECYRIWKKKVEFIFCSALADSTPKQLVSYLEVLDG